MVKISRLIQSKTLRMTYDINTFFSMTVVFVTVFFCFLFVAIHRQKVNKEIQQKESTREKNELESERGGRKGKNQQTVYIKKQNNNKNTYFQMKFS